MKRINLVSCRLEREGEFLTFIDLYQPKGNLEIWVNAMGDRSIVMLNGTQLAFGHSCTHFEVS